MKLALIASVLLLACAPLYAATLVDIPLNQQINIGLGDAVTGQSSFQPGPGGFVRRLITSSTGAGGWYFGPTVNLVKAGYGPYVDMSGPGVVIRYTARYCQDVGNSSPYGDAPIFVQLIDVNGKNGGLGISYGAQPNPTYPEWITCTDEITVGSWPTDAGFDASKVVAVKFFGTDWTGTGSDFIDIRDLQVIDQTTHNPIPIAQTKGMAGSDVEIAGAVSASFAGASQFYVQEIGGVCGIQVRSSTAPDAGSAVAVEGTVQTDPDTGEMYVQASNWFRNGSGTASALGMTTRSLGGGSMASQQGPEGGIGLNNIGGLVRICGKVTGGDSTAGYVYVSDGSGAEAEAGHEGARVDLSALYFAERPAWSVGDSVIVTGVSSLYRGADGGRYRVVRIRRPADFRNLDDTGNSPKVFRALVVNFDPFCPAYGGKRTHQVFYWNDPHTLAQGYMSDLSNCSGGWCQYQIVDWFDANYHPYFEDGFQYSPDDYVYAWNHRGTTPMHPGTSDYYRLVSDKTYPHNQPRSIEERIAADEFDEVFFFGAPSGFAGWEAAMAGPSPFFVNGGTYAIPGAKRNFVMMGFNYERGVDCMLEDFCHRTECVMSRVYSPPSWWFPTYPITNNWDRFRMFDKIQAGQAACGICHYAPNSQSDYDWGNTTYVWSTCNDWLYNWPNLLGDVTKRWVNCNEWGGGDMRLHHKWWLTRLPKAAGINPDGKQNNWWKYSCDFNGYPESR